MVFEEQELFNCPRLCGTCWFRWKRTEHVVRHSVVDKEIIHSPQCDGATFCGLEDGTGRFAVEKCEHPIAQTHFRARTPPAR